MQHNVHIEKKHISHYLRSRLISIHSTLALIMLRAKEAAVKEELQIAHDTLIPQALSRIDLMYYSLLDKKDYETIMQNHAHAAAYKNIEISSYKKRFISKIDFLLDIMDDLVEKMEISSKQEVISIQMYLEDHNDDDMTAKLFVICLQKALEVKDLHLDKKEWGYQLQFELLHLHA